jgi:hypothetical protein
MRIGVMNFEIGSSFGYIPLGYDSLTEFEK